VYTRFLWCNLKKRNNLENPGVDGRIILRWFCRKWDVVAESGSIWSRLRKVAGLVNAVMNLRVHKMRGISWLAENRLASQKVLCSMV
jgi:hypothetical protein